MARQITIDILDYTNSVLGTLDITDSKNFPLVITYQVNDIRDLNGRSGAYSKTFKIPATKHNNKLLNFVGIPNIKDDKNMTQQKDCRILVDGLEFASGLLQITSISSRKKTESYSCTFFGNNLAWALLLEEQEIKDIVLDNSTSLDYSSPSIMSTWTDLNATTSTSPIVYPIISTGDFNSGGLQSRVQNLSKYSTTMMHDPNSNRPNPQQDIQPCVWIYDIFKKTVESLGYQISSSFIETDFFKRLLYKFNFTYKDTYKQWRKWSAKVHKNLIGGQTAGASVIYSPVIQLNFRAVDYDDSGIFPSPTSGGDTATIQEYGYYNLKSIICLEYVQRSGQSTNTFEGYIERTCANGQIYNVAYDSITLTSPIYSGSTYEHVFDLNWSGYLNKGDVLKIFVESNVIRSYSSLYIHIDDSTFIPSNNRNTECNINIQSIKVAAGQTYDLADILPTDTALDFIKGVSHCFNLQFNTDVLNKTITIEEYDSYYNNASLGNALDWTYKQDLTKEVTDKWLEKAIKRDIVFKYKEDSNDGRVSAINKQNNGNELHAYYETLNNTFEKGEEVFENPHFSPTKMESDGDAQHGFRPMIPVMWKEDAPITPTFPSRPAKDWNFAPRILYWNGDGTPSTVPSASYNTQKHIVFGMQMGTGSALKLCQKATSVNWGYTSVPLLSYDDKWMNGTTVDGLYTTYYENMFTQLKETPKIRTVYFNLKIKDILNLNLQRLVYIDGVYYRINKIIDFSPAKNISTKVELLLWANLT